MNVQEILSQSMENKRLNGSMMNQSQDVSQRMALISSLVQQPRSHLEKYHTQHLNNNYISDVKQSSVLASPTSSRPSAPSGTPRATPSSAAASAATTGATSWQRIGDTRPTVGGSAGGWQPCSRLSRASEPAGPAWRIKLLII